LEEQSAKKKILDIYHDEKLFKIGIIDIPAFYIDFEAMRKGDPKYKYDPRREQGGALCHSPSPLGRAVQGGEARCAWH
ncbi:hypothetical protein LCGC14_3085830, partial [marine sediment metagenome]